MSNSNGMPSEGELAHALTMLWMAQQDLKELSPAAMKKLYAKAFMEIKSQNIERF